MPPKKKLGRPPKKDKPKPEPDPDEETEDDEPVEPVRQKSGLPNQSRQPEPEPEEEEDEEELDDEEEFVTPADVRKAKVSTAPTTDKMPGQSGFIADIIAGAGEKLHEVEYGITQHPVFQHSPADERIWTALGRYAESQLDPAKWGIVILLVVLLGSESMKIAVYAKFRADQANAAKKKGNRK